MEKQKNKKTCSQVSSIKGLNYKTYLRLKREHLIFAYKMVLSANKSYSNFDKAVERYYGCILLKRKINNIMRGMEILLINIHLVKWTGFTQPDKQKLILTLPKKEKPLLINTINPLTPKSDQLLISPYNITPESNIKVTRIKEMITNL